MLSVVCGNFRISIGLLGVVMLSVLMPCLVKLSVLYGECHIFIVMLTVVIMSVVLWQVSHFYCYAGCC